MTEIHMVLKECFFHWQLGGKEKQNPLFSYKVKLSVHYQYVSHWVLQLCTTEFFMALHSAKQKFKQDLISASYKDKLQNKTSTNTRSVISLVHIFNTMSIKQYYCYDL